MFSAVSVCLSVCQFVCLFVGTLTAEWLNVGRWNLAVRCNVQKSRPSLNLGSKVKGQGYCAVRSGDQCTPIRCNRGRHYDVTASMTSHQSQIRQSTGFAIKRLRRWENQRMLSSFTLFLLLSQELHRLTIKLFFSFKHIQLFLAICPTWSLSFCQACGAYFAKHLTSY